MIPRDIVSLACNISRQYSKELAGVCLGFRQGDKVIVDELVIGENLSESSDRFYLDPAALLEAFKYAELSGYDVVALLHTHREGTTPSLLDLEGMKLWPLPWIIIDESTCSAISWIIEGDIPKNIPTDLLPT